MKQRVSATYAASGVDTDVEAQASRRLYEYAKQTWVNRRGLLGDPSALVDSFAGVKAFAVHGLPAGTVSWSNADGVGTKPRIAEAVGRYDTIATDLLAMVADDAAILGAEPVHAVTILTVNTLGRDMRRLRYIEELARGYIPAAKASGVAIINGELAQHPTMGELDRFSFDWGATLTWFGHRSRLLDGSAIRPGDAIVGLREPGLRCNGITLVRQVLGRRYGDGWVRERLGGTTLGELALLPSTIYAKLLVALTGGYDLSRQPRAAVHGAVHVTGGGLPEKLGARLLGRLGLGADLDNLFEPSPLLLHCQELGRVPDREAYRTWNMGQGMLVITPEPDAVLTICAEQHIAGRVVGRITAKPGLRLTSRGLQGGRLRL